MQSAARVAAQSAAAAAPPYPSALPGEEIRSPGSCRSQARGFSLRCPSIDPGLRYRFIVLHERCADFDRGLFLQQLEAQSPAAGRRVWLGDDVLDFRLLGRHDAAQYFRIDRFQPLSGDVEHEDRGVVASDADAGSGKSRE